MVVAPLAPNGSTGATPYEQEVKLEKLFGELQAGFKKMEGIADPNKQANILKDLTNKMQEAKSLIKEFEQEARTDNMPAAELTSRKKGLVQQLNEYIAKKKELGNDIAGRKELIGAAKRGDGPKDYNNMDTTQLIVEGRKKIKESDEDCYRQGYHGLHHVAADGGGGHHCPQDCTHPQVYQYGISTATPATSDRTQDAWLQSAHSSPPSLNRYVDTIIWQPLKEHL
ncbi:hypothetical protein WJX79_009584 [Trebouxia sp. C0005]